MEDDKRRRKLEAAKEKLAAYKKRKSTQKDAGKVSDSEPSSFSQSDTSLSLSPLPLSEAGTNIKKPPERENVKSESSSISENIELSNSENDRSLQEIVVASIPLDSPDLSLKSVLPQQSNKPSVVSHQSSVLSDSSVISLHALEKFELENNNFLDSSQNVLDELIKQDQFDISKTDSVKSNPFDDLSSITLKSERITGCENKTSQECQDENGKLDEARRKSSEEEMPYKEKETVAAQNSTDVESLKEFNSSNQSTLSLGTSTTEYKQYYDKVNMGTIEFQDLLSHRDDHIKQLTDALQQVLEDRNILQEQTDYFAQEIADLKEQLIQTTEIIKKNNWNLASNELVTKETKPELGAGQNQVADESESTSLQSLANELNIYNARLNFKTDINFDFEDPEFNESMTPEEKKIVADMRNKINMYIQQKVDECKTVYASELKVLRDQLEYEKNLNKRVIPSYKNTEDSVSTLPSMENNDKIITDQSINFEKQAAKQDLENNYEIDDQMFNETFSPEEINIIADMRTKIYLFIHQTIGKYKTDHKLELKVLKDRLENEKITHDVEVDRLRQLLMSVKSGSTEINEMRQELNEQHSKEMEELRTYFEQRCAEIEKHYSEEIFSQQSRKMSGSSVSELESEIFPPQLGPCGDTPAIISATTTEASPKRDLASVRLELQNKYHAELEILREDYDNRLDELKINHENIVQELEQKYQTVIDALKTDLEEAQKIAVATQEVASSGDFEIAEVVESYERRLQEQVMLAKIDIVSALEQQIQTLVSSSGDELEWPAELLQLRDRLTEHWHGEIRDIRTQHAEEIAKLKDEHDRSLARALEREKRNSLKSGDDLDLRKERDNLKKATTNLRHLVAELLKYFTKCEDELNNTLVEELLKYGWDKDSSKVTDSDLNESSQSHSGSEQFDTITISPRVKRVHFTPDVTGIIDLINETTVDNVGTTKDISSEFRTELDLCLSRLKSEANAILSLTSNLKTKPFELPLAVESKPTPVEDRISSLTRQLLSETQMKNELNMQLEEFKAYIQSLETEKQNLEEQMEHLVAKQQVLMSELDNAKEKINDLIESGRKEIVSEGYGENEIIGSNTLDGRISSLAELQERARGFLAEADGTTGHPLLQLLEELCRESDKIMEDAKKDHEDLVQQIEAADKKLRATSRFLEEQAVEREVERDEAHKEISALREQLRDTERTRATCERVHTEEAQGLKLNACTCSSDFNATVVETVERLEVQMREMTVLMSECEAKKTDVENELKEAIDKIWVLRDIVRDLESQIEDKNKTEVELRNIATQLEDKINFELKENEELRNKFISLEGCEKESQYQEVIRKLESENQKLKVSSELVGPDGVLKQVKTQLSEFEKTLDKRTKDLESLHTVISNTNCSSPSEDMSIRDQIRPPGSSTEPDSDLPLEQLARLKDKLIRHARAEDAAMKRIRDLEMQLYTAKQDYDEMQSERDVLQEQLSEQLVLISSLQLRLDEQRLRVESAQKQSNASFEHKIYELKNEIQEQKDTIHNRDMIIQDLNTVLEETNKRLTEQQKQLNSASEIEKQIVDQFQVEMNRLQTENKSLTSKMQERESSPTKNLNDSLSRQTPSLSGEFLDSLLSDKNADIDRLKAKINEIETELQFYGSLNLSKDQLLQISKHVLSSSKKSDMTSLIETSEVDPLRRQELSFDSIHSGNGENLEYKRNPNETVFIGSTFRDSKYADKVHSPFVASELSTIEKVGPPCVNLTVEEVPMPNKGSGDTKHVHFDEGLELNRLQSKLSNLQEEIQFKDKTIQDYQSNLEEIRKKLEFSCDSIREKTETLSDEIDTLKEEKQNLQVDLAEVKMQLHDKINKLNNIEKDSERKDKMYMNLAKEKRDLESMIKVLEDRIEEFKDFEDIMSEKNKEIFNLEQQLATLTPVTSSESLKESILLKESELNMLKEHIFILESKLEDKLKEIEKYCADFDQIKTALQEKNELLAKYDEENKKLISLSSEQLNQEAEKEKQMNEKLLTYEQKINELKTVVQKYEQKIELDKQNSERIIQEYKQKLELNKQNSETIIQEYKQKLQSNKQNSDDVKLVSSELELEIAKLKKELAEKDLILTQNDSLIDELNKEIQHLQEYLNEKDKIINQMTVDSNSLHVALEAIQSKIQESGNVVDLKKRLREEQNLSGALYEELKYLKQSIEHYESVEATNAIETLVLLKESVEREKLTNEELKSTKDALIYELEKVKQKLKIEEENVEKLTQMLDEEKMNSNMVQIQDANIIESMRLRLEALLEHEKSEEENMNKYKQILDEERINFNVIHIRDANSIESLKVRIDDLLKREQDSEKLLKIERRIREELERQLATANSLSRSPFRIDFVHQHQAIENDVLRNDADAGHLFGKYLKSESYRKALVFQKRYLLGLLASYQKCTKNLPDLNYVLPKTQISRPINRFRAVAYAIISIQRMQYIVRRWHTGKRIGGSLISKRSGLVQLVASPKPINLPETRPWSGNSPPCKDRTNRRQELPLGNTIQESISLAPLQAPALLSQYIERFDSIQQRLGLAIDRSGT